MERPPAPHRPRQHRLHPPGGQGLGSGGGSELGVEGGAEGSGLQNGSKIPHFFPRGGVWCWGAGAAPQRLSPRPSVLAGELFAQAPVEQFPSIAVESVTDSSRYFVIRIEDENGAGLWDMGVIPERLQSPSPI